MDNTYAQKNIKSMRLRKSAVKGIYLSLAKWFNNERQQIIRKTVLISMGKTRQLLINIDF